MVKPQNGNFGGENNGNPWLSTRRCVESCSILDSCIEPSGCAEKLRGFQLRELGMVWNWSFPKITYGKLLDVFGVPVVPPFWGNHRRVSMQNRCIAAVSWKPKLLWIGSSYVRWACNDYWIPCHSNHDVAIQWFQSWEASRFLKWNLPRRRCIISVVLSLRLMNSRIRLGLPEKQFVRCKYDQIIFTYTYLFIYIYIQISTCIYIYIHMYMIKYIAIPRCDRRSCLQTERS